MKGGNSMANVVKVYGRKVFAGPGVWSYVAEAEVREGEETVYVTLCDYDVSVEYTVAKGSVYGFMAGDAKRPVDGFEEEYTNLADAKRSKYGKVFDVLRKMATLMERGIG